MSDINIVPETSIGLYRIFQESLTNVAKHSQATTVNAFLKTKDDNLVLAISDNGIGFNLEETAGKRTLGLVSIRERALMMNGTYEILSLPGEGTTVLVTVPLNLN